MAAEFNGPDLAYRARLALDRARLSFYELPRERREELLRVQTARSEAAAPADSPPHARRRAQPCLRVSRVGRALPRKFHCVIPQC
jgi:hypothetical protein